MHFAEKNVQKGGFMASFLILIVGLLSEFRLLRLFSEEKIIRDHQRKFFSFIFFIFSAGIALFFQKKPILIWLILLSANFLSYFVPFFIRQKRKGDFELKAIELIDVLVTLVKSGRSFREAIKRVQTENMGTPFYFQEIFQAISIEQAPERMSSDAQVQRIYTELLQISKSQHRISDKLVALRRILKTERWFKMKIKQVLLQSRAQSIVMSTLYVGLLSYVFGSVGIGGNMDLIIFSLALYFLGTIWIWKMGRSYQWKA